MAVKKIYDQVSTKECVGRGDRTRGRLVCQADTLPIDQPRLEYEFGQKSFSYVVVKKS